MWLLECPKAPVSQHALEVKVLNVPKHCWNLHDSNFTLTIRSCHTKLDVYHPSYSDLKCRDRHLTRERLMRCIVAIIERNSCKKFQRNYLKKEKAFLELRLRFSNAHKILSILKKKTILITLIFPELLIPKHVVTWMPKSSSFRTPFEVKRGKGSKTLLKSTRQHFCAKFWFFSDKVRCVSWLLVGSKKWGASFNMSTADRYILVIIERNSCNKF